MPNVYCELFKAITTLLASGIIVCITTASFIGFQMRNESKTTNDDKLCHHGSCSSNYGPKNTLPTGHWKGNVLRDSQEGIKRNFPPGAILPNKTFPKIERADLPDVMGSIDAQRTS